MPFRLVPSGAMGTSEAPAATKPEIPPGEEFLAWLGETSTPALISERHEQFYAYCFELGIAGSGSTREAAIEEATDLLVSYLAVSFSEGRSYEEAKKPPPLQVRVRSWVWVAWGKLLRIGPSLSRLGRLISVPTTSPNSRRLAH